MAYLALSSRKKLIQSAMFKPLDDDIVLLEHGMTPGGNIDPDLTKEICQTTLLRHFPPRLKMASTSFVRSLSTLTLRYIYVMSIERLEIGDWARPTYWRGYIL